MIVDKVWKLTNTVRVGLDARSSHTQTQSTFPDTVCSYCPPCHGVFHYENLTTFLFFSKKNFPPSCKMKKSNDKRGRTVSDDAGGKSLSDTSTSAGAKLTVIHTSVNIFEASKRDKPQYFVDKVKDKRRTKNNNLELLIGWSVFPADYL